MVHDMAKLTLRSFKILFSGVFLLCTAFSYSRAAAFQNGTPKPPAIISVKSVKKSGGLYDLKIVVSIFQGNTQLPTTSTTVKAAKKTCVIRARETSCTIKGLRAKLKVSVSATSRNKNGSSPRSPIVAYKVGSATKTITPGSTIAPDINQTTTTLGSTDPTPPAGGGFISAYGSHP